MNEAKFTKGPWVKKPALGTEDEFLYWDIRVEGGRYRGDIGSVHNAEHIGGITKEECSANANLIAAAPEMYEKGQFKRNVIIHDSPEFEGEWVAVPREDFIAFRAALAKARGES